MITTPSNLALRLGNSRKVQAVPDLASGSKLWSQIRTHHGWGASNAPRATIINTDTGEAVARVSYNGRLWDITTGIEITL